MDVSDINKIASRKRLYTDAEKLREKVSRETAKIIKIKVAQDTAYWDLKQKLQQIQESHERLQQNMVEVQMQYEAVSGQYQEELRLRPETLNQVNCTREICDVLEDYGERMRRSIERCRADQRQLSAAYGACGATVKSLAADSAQVIEREKELRETLRTVYKRHDTDMRQLVTAQEQLGAVRARADELAKQLERCQDELRQREDAMATIQTKAALLVTGYETQCTELKRTIAAQEKEIQMTRAEVETERSSKKASEERARDFEERAHIADERTRTAKENIDALKREVAAAREQALHARAQCEEANTTIIQLKNEVLTLNENTQVKEKVIDDRCLQIKELQTEIAQLKVSISVSESEKMELKGWLHQVQEQNQDSTNRVEELMGQVTSLKRSLEELQIAYDKQRAADSKKIEELNSAVSERDIELNTKTGTINKLMSDIKAAAATLDNAHKQHEVDRQNAAANTSRLETTLRVKDAQLDDQMRLIRDLRTEKERLHDDKERLHQRINDMQATIDNIQKLAGRGPGAPSLAPPAPERDRVERPAPDAAAFDFLSDDSDSVNAHELKRRYEAVMRGDIKPNNVPIAQMKNDLNFKNRIFKNKRQENKAKKIKD